MRDSTDPFYSGCLLSLRKSCTGSTSGSDFFPYPLPLLFLKSTIKQNKELVALPINGWFLGGRLARSWTRQDFFFLLILSHFCCISFGYFTPFNIFKGVCRGLRKGSAYFAIYCLQQDGKEG